ncbi:type II toxin-antitoxin system Phd/YefM family antitoxin [bacterium]|nr:type II toxin-antitoxin system Phd/YefM family antitoxin [bacterium]
MQVSISDAKKHLNQLVSSDDASIITKNGSPKAALIPYEEYVKMIRLQREQEDLAAIKRADEFFAGKREAMSQDELDDMLGFKNDSESRL